MELKVSFLIVCLVLLLVFMVNSYLSVYHIDKHGFKKGNENVIKDGLEWLENEDRTINDYENKYTECENITKPIFTKMYQSQSQTQPEQPEQPEQPNQSQPEIDEVV